MSAASQGIKFIRKGGRIIPIRGAQGLAEKGSLARAGATTSAAGIAHHILKKPPEIKPRKAFEVAGTATAIASGVISGAFFGKGAKGFLAGTLGGIGLDVASTSANIAAYAGKGFAARRTKAAAKQEAFNIVVGNAAYLGTILAVPSSRAKVVEYAGKAFNMGKKFLNLG